MKKTTVLAVFFITTIVLSGCTNKQSNNVNNSQFRRPDFGQPDRPADISGIVSSITGNEVSVLKFDRPDRNQDEQNSETDSQDSQQNQNNLRMNLNGSSGRTEGGRIYGGPPGGGRPGEMDEDSRAAMLERMKEMSSGEETIVIPVGIQMLKSDTTSDSGQPEMLEATLDDITTDKMIQVWLDESISDRKIAEFVLVIR